MHSRSAKAKVIAFMFGLRASFVLAVVAVSFVPGISTLVALLIVSAVLFAFRSASVLFPAQRRAQDGRNPGGLAGDRSPRTPFPFRPPAAAQQPIPPIDPR